MISPNTIKFQELYIELSYLCTAECRHCCVSSNPHAENARLDIDLVFKAINQSLVIDQIKPKIAIAGGEPTLFWDDLLTIIGYAAGSNLQVVLISNGWWGEPKKLCEKKLDQLIEKGLNRLEISANGYHSENTRSSAMNNLIELCQGRPIDLFVHNRTDRYKNRPTKINSPNGYPLEIADIPIMPIVRAEDNINNSELAYTRGFPPGNCRHDLSFLITPTADCYPCCGGSELNKSLFLGNIKEENLQDIISRFNRRKLLQILIQKGPSYIAGALKADGFTQIEEDCHVGICDLCCQIFQSPEQSAAAERWANSPDSLAPNGQNQKELANQIVPILRKLPLINPDKLNENVCRRLQHQPSGTYLLPDENYYLKVVPTSSPFAKKVLAQANWLEYNRNHGIRCIPEVFFKFSEENGLTGYVMPRYQWSTPKAKLNTVSRVLELLQCLETIWNIPAASFSPQVIDWNGYVFKVEKILSQYNREIAPLFRDLGIRIGKMKQFQGSFNVHGDPTFENLTFDRNGTMILLDPNPQYEPAVPIPELDFAKVMQSAFGWEAFVYGREAELHWHNDLQPIVLSRFGKIGWPICTWLFISHLVRTLPYGAKINNPYGLISTIKKFLYILRDDLQNFNRE